MIKNKNEWKIPVFGLTGGIASGKSKAGGFFKRNGAEVIDADIILRKLIQKGKPVYNRIVDSFGEDILDKRGKISRKKLASLVFSNPERKRLLESITHPEIMKAVIRRIETISQKEFKPVILEGALIIESGVADILDGVIVVACPENIQIQRLRLNRRMSEKEIKLRLKSQLSNEEKSKKADYLIWNDSTISKLKREVSRVFRMLKNSPIYREKRKNWLTTEKTS